MIYSFWAFAAAWISLVFLYGLVQRMGALEQQVADLCDHTRATAGPSRADSEGENARGLAPPPGGPAEAAGRLPDRSASSGEAVFA